MNERDTKGTSSTFQEIISRAVLATNVLRGKKRVCDIKLARGYKPSILALLRTPVDSKLIEANYEQIVRRTLSKMVESRSPNTISSHLLSRGIPVYFFEKLTKHSV